MKTLKSLKEFEKESNKLSSKELKNISGGMNYYYTLVTGRHGGDRQNMCQQFEFDGDSYVTQGPPYTIGAQYNWP